MSLSDCVKCWSTPCTCGYDYRNYDCNQRKRLAAVVLGVPYDELCVLLGTRVPKIHPMSEQRETVVKEGE